MYELSMFYSRDFPQYSSPEDRPRNRLARIHNTLVSAMSRTGMLPRLIVIVLENDLIDFMGHNDYGVSEMYGRILNTWRATFKKQWRSSGNTYHRNPFGKDWPKFVWIMPTIHSDYCDNTLRRKFGTEMNGVITKLQNSMALK